MIRYLIAPVFVLIVFPAMAQDVLFVGNGANMNLSTGAAVTIQGGMYAASGSSILNNGILYVDNNQMANQSKWTDENANGVFAKESTGMVYFQSAHEHSIAGNTVFPSVTLDAAGGVILANDISIANNLVLKNGQFNTGNFKLIVLDKAGNSVLPDVANADYGKSWINGKLQRAIASNSDVYDFPVGNLSNAYLLQFVNNHLAGSSFLTASFDAKPGNDAGLIVAENGTPYSSVNNGGVWYLNPDASASGGNYALHLFFKGFSGLADNQFGILRRDDASSNAADWTIPSGSSLESLNGDGRKVTDGFSRRKDMTTFSQFGIGMTTAALPVLLLNFNAIRETKNSVKLNWATATEINNRGFEIERKLDNENQFSYKGFEGSKAVGGNSQTQLEYAFHDLNSFSGVTYYRIKQIDIDNHFVYTGIKAVKGLDNITVDVSIMPNPNKGQFKININGVNKSHEAFISDMNGKIIKQLIVQPMQEVNVQGLPPSTYILTIKDVFGKGENFREKIVIVR